MTASIAACALADDVVVGLGPDGGVDEIPDRVGQRSVQGRHSIGLRRAEHLE